MTVTNTSKSAAKGDYRQWVETLKTRIKKGEVKDRYAVSSTVYDYANSYKERKKQSSVRYVPTPSQDHRVSDQPNIADEMARSSGESYQRYQEEKRNVQCHLLLHSQRLLLPVKALTRWDKKPQKMRKKKGSHRTNSTRNI